MLKPEMEEENCNVVAQSIPELSLACFKLTKEIKSNIDENDLLKNHLKLYYETSPLPEISFKDFDMEWFNVSEHLTVEKHFSSRIVILDFFTYCCINCLHILPDLNALEQKYSADESPVLVVGIHSAKFTNEKQTKNVLDAIKKNEITHPVANDVKCRLWNDLGISCWPTLLILGPGGVPLFTLVGEGHRDVLFKVVEQSILYFSELRKLEVTKLPLMPSIFIPSKLSDLQYPGKVTCYNEGLIISDTGNHRILVTDFDGKINMIIGSGLKGFRDGSFEEASFNNPQGVIYHPSGSIFVADTNNHAIREIVLNKGFVKTIAGKNKSEGPFGTNQDASSPWDLCLAHTIDLCPEKSHPNLLLIAMAGSHQIWGFFLSNGQWLKKCSYIKGAFVCLAGTGKEENRNTSYPLKASFAQPSGICVSTSSVGQVTFIADSESSSIRQFSLVDGSVKRMLGGAIDPSDLFAYGDIDGIGPTARFQHPLGVATDNERVYVADSYNHKIKVITMMDKKYSVETMNTEDSSMKLNEPGGLCHCKDRNSLIIANTNDSSIVEFDLKEKTLRKIDVSSEADSSTVTEDTVDSVGGDYIVKILNSQQKNLVFNLEVQLPDSFHPTPGTEHSYQIITETNSLRGSFQGTSERVTLPTNDAETLYTVKCILKICSDEGMCYVNEVIQKIKVIKEERESSEIMNHQSEETLINVFLKPKL